MNNRIVLLLVVVICFANTFRLVGQAYLLGQGYMETWTDVFISTPRGTPVTVRMDIQPPLQPDDVNLKIALAHQFYPNAILWGMPTITYNCHAYALGGYNVWMQTSETGLIQENSCRPAGRDGAPISNRLGSATGGSVKQSRLEAGAPFS